jgi:1-acyl-sn-glycerol-3-phosphate acyltransferase
MEKSPERLEILSRMEKLENQGIFDQDVENDPPELELFPDQVDYLHKKLKTKIMTYLTLKAGTKFLQSQINSGNFVIKEIIGTENLPDKKQGAIVTCNHFNPLDNFVVLKALMPSLKKGRFWKVIREGNYTNPPKGFDMFMRYGDTLPISRNRKTMHNLMQAIDILLKRGDKVLVYPEKALWWNYRKPRPFKIGAFKFAVSAGVPVIPMFITMEDTDKIGGDGFPIQAYTVHIGECLRADENLTAKENINMLMEKNYQFCVDTYEKFYNTKLKFDIKEGK